MQGSWRNSYLRYREFFLDTVSAYKKKPEIMMFLEIILTFSTITLLSIFALKPTLITITGLVKEIDNRKAVIVKMDKKLNDLETAQQVVFRNSKSIAILNYAIPTGPSVETLSGQVEGLSVTTGLPINSFSIDETVLTKESGPQKREKESILPEGTNSLGVTLRTSGPFDSLENFLSITERMRRPLVIESMNLSQTISATTGEGLVLSINGKVPYIAQ